MRPIERDLVELFTDHQSGFRRFTKKKSSGKNFFHIISLEIGDFY